tara:strand:+ start:3488 stop:4726 length:1239 start_codon:yes stop_codon:yes gene_type:complete
MRQLHYSFTPQIISALLALVTYRIYTELLVPEELGKAMLIIGVIAFVDALISSSINQTIFYYVCKEKFKYFIFKFIRKNIKYSFFFGFILIFLIILISNFYSQIQLIYYSVLFLIFFCYLIIEPFKASMFSMLNAEGSRKVFGLQVFLDAFFNFTMIVFFLYLSASWYNLLIGILVARYLSLISNFYLIDKIYLKQIKSLTLVNLLSVKDFIAYMLPISSMGILGWITAFADRFIVAGSIGLADAGVYSLATGLTGRPYNVTTSALTVHFRPSLFKSFNNTDKTKFNRSFHLWLFYAIAIGFLGVILFYFTADFLTNFLISTQYREQTSALLFLLAIAQTFNIISHSYENKFLAIGKTKLLLQVQIVCVLYPIFLIFIGGYFYALIGAVLGKIFADFFKLITILIVTKYKKL